VLKQARTRNQAPAGTTRTIGQGVGFVEISCTAAFRVMSSPVWAQSPLYPYQRFHPIMLTRLSTWNSSSRRPFRQVSTRMAATLTGDSGRVYHEKALIQRNPMVEARGVFKAQYVPLDDSCSLHGDNTSTSGQEVHKNLS
jgi:hypothetical protein